MDIQIINSQPTNEFTITDASKIFSLAITACNAKIVKYKKVQNSCKKRIRKAKSEKESYFETKKKIVQMKKNYFANGKLSAEEISYWTQKKKILGL